MLPPVRSRFAIRNFFFTPPDPLLPRSSLRGRLPDGVFSKAHRSVPGSDLLPGGNRPWRSHQTCTLRKKVHISCLLKCTANNLDIYTYQSLQTEWFSWSSKVTWRRGQKQETGGYLLPMLFFFRRLIRITLFVLVSKEGAWFPAESGILDVPKVFI